MKKLMTLALVGAVIFAISTNAFAYWMPSSKMIIQDPAPTPEAFQIEKANN